MMVSQNRAVSAAEIISQCQDLQSNWQTTRNAQFKDWYQYIVMEDKYKEAKLESFVGNDPRTFYDMSLHLLVPDKVLPRIPLENIAPADIDKVNSVEDFLAKQWMRLERLSMMRGRGGWIREFAGFLLITGWYSIMSYVNDEEVVAEIWNPADVYPEFSDDGLFRVAHIYSMTGKAANRKALMKGWKLDQQFSGNSWPVFYDYWTMERGVVENAIVVQNGFAKPLQEEASFRKIPIYCSPVAGLPDRGSIAQGDGGAWKRHVGEGLMAANTNVNDYSNKINMFLMQLLRDTAQARWVEKSQGAPKVKPEDIFKRGAVFHLGLNESLDTVDMPPIPVELRAMSFDVNAMKQKGSLPDVLYANVQGQVSGYMMQQISAAAIHVLKPYLQAIKFVIEEMCNDWLFDMQEWKYEPHDFKMPKLELPPVEVDLRLDIPGDFVNRATIARMLDPEFRLSEQTVSDILFPEIKNPLNEQARVNRDRALQHPMMLNLYLIEALKARAAMLIEANDSESAGLYAKAAELLSSQLTAQPAQPVQVPPRQISQQYE